MIGWKRFAAQLDKIAPEEYNVNEVALQQIIQKLEWWNTEMQRRGAIQKW